jgi:hypothetical protein
MNDQARDASASRPPQAEVREDRSIEQRLKDKSPLLDAEDDAPAPSGSSGLERLKALGKEIEQGGTAVQSVAVAAVQILERALSFEREAADAALSLAQQEKLQSMVGTAEEATRILRSTLTANGGKVVHLCTDDSPTPPADDQPWWFALTDALEVLEEGTSRMASLTSAQPSESPAHELSREIASLLRGHHDALLLEAEQWIG